MILQLREDFARLWAGEDPFAQVDALQGEVYRNVKGRRTLRFESQGRAYFAKIHHGVGWAEIIKNLLTLKRPVLGAENEWRAIARLHSIGIATMTTVGFGSRGWNPATRHSFILTEALDDTISLEDYCGRWLHEKPAFRVKLKLITELARISSAMHGEGICHRDFYLCHFLLHEEAAFSAGQVAQVQLSLIDLHRAMIQHRLPVRWVVKDVAGLYFSALHIGLNRHDFLRFVRAYSGRSLRECFTAQATFWTRVERRAKKMDRKLNH